MPRRGPRRFRAAVAGGPPAGACGAARQRLPASPVTDTPPAGADCACRHADRACAKARTPTRLRSTGRLRRDASPPPAAPCMMRDAGSLPRGRRDASLSCPPPTASSRPAMRLVQGGTAAGRIRAYCGGGGGPAPAHGPRASRVPAGRLGRPDLPAEHRRRERAARYGDSAARSRRGQGRPYAVRSRRGAGAMAGVPAAAPAPPRCRTEHGACSREAHARA